MSWFKFTSVDDQPHPIAIVEGIRGIQRIRAAVAEHDPEALATICSMSPGTAGRWLADRYGAEDYRGNMATNDAADCLVAAMKRWLAHGPTLPAYS